MKRLSTIRSGIGIGLTAAALLAGLSLPAVGSGDWTLTLQGGGGKWDGEAAYSIGGHVWDPEFGDAALPDKISELKFPLDVTFGTLEGSLAWKKRLEAHGLIMLPLSDPSSDVTDADWEFGPWTPSTYSTSDAELTAWLLDGGVRFWFIDTAYDNGLALSAGCGMNLLLLHTDWTARNLDQWEPLFPASGHYYRSGDVGTYKADITMPYVDLSTVIRWKRLSGRVELGLGTAIVEDEDDHLLRGILATTEMTGIGAKGALEVRYDLTAHVFVLARVSALSIEADGTEEDFVYAVEDYGSTWEIDHDFTLDMTTAGVSIGCIF